MPWCVVVSAYREPGRASGGEGAGREIVCVIPAPDRDVPPVALSITIAVAVAVAVWLAPHSVLAAIAGATAVVLAAGGVGLVVRRATGPRDAVVRVRVAGAFVRITRNDLVVDTMLEAVDDVVLDAYLEARDRGEPLHAPPLFSRVALVLQGRTAPLHDDATSYAYADQARRVLQVFLREQGWLPARQRTSRQKAKDVE